MRRFSIPIAEEDAGVIDALSYNFNKLLKKVVSISMVKIQNFFNIVMLFRPM